MSYHPPIEEWRARLARSRSLEELKRRLISAAPEFHEAVRRKRMIGDRDDLGLRVFSLEMPYLGLSGLRGSRALVALQKSPDSIARRQTLAHECAHGLLRDVDRLALNLTREEEDRLCSWFARRALMPPARVERYLIVNGFPADIDRLQNFCRHFRVSLRAAIAALNEHGSRADSTVLIAATYRAHEKRPGEREFRVDAAASDPDLLVPRDRRLSSMGLRGICWWASQATPGTTRSGAEPYAVFRSRRTHPKSWYGEAPWSARVYKAATGHEPDARSLIVFLDRSALKGLATDPTRKRVSLGARGRSLHRNQTELVPG